MNFDEAYEYLGKHDDLYLKAQGTSTENFIKGLQILRKYSKNIPEGSDHDIIYVCDYPDDMLIEEIEELSRLGFHLDDESCGWAKFT